MRRATLVRARLAAVVVAATCAAVFATPGLAVTPPGNGLVIVPIPFTCDGIGEVTVTANPGNGPPASGAFWILDGQLILVQEVTVIQDGVIVFHKTYGNKAGHQPTVRCTGTEPDGTFHIVEIVFVP
jgi:hypothetical protein